MLRFRLGKISVTITQLNGARPRVNAPVPISIGMMINRGGKFMCNVRAMTTWPRDINSALEINKVRRLNFRIRGKAINVQMKMKI